ncbi:PAS domain S-box protein [Neobacillus sp. PS3-12]|jgi:diguanylate cyclase (GGDEF)-like protein/PAS domain S-box-containing protein|uniref:PAS domain S-box protein n=1 Tax=Neobacillus sp. PS3-12 TaxID=3070677 RepID=UPI0027E05681|nr:PAS domain S-box protein [Neobacillus sp. PS3-12]WML51233.1 PAS domain S-box protein [Neobacillus sp. PS3-12]
MNDMLKESFAEIYRSIIEHNPDAIFVFSKDGKVEEVNPVVTKIFGYSQEEVKGIHYQEFIVPEQVEKVNNYFGQVLQGTSCEDSIDVFHRSGDILHLHVKSIPLMIQNKIVGIFCVAKDMTRQKQLEASLKESEERYRKLVEYSPKGILVHRKGTILYANPSALSMLNEENLMDKLIFSYIHPNEHEMYKQRISETDIGKELPLTEIKMMRRDGEVIIVEMVGIWISFNGIPTILTIFNDVTEKKKIENALKESENKYRLLTENSLDLVQLVNPDGIISYASPSHKIILGYEPEEYIGKRGLCQLLDETFTDTSNDSEHISKSKTCEIIQKHNMGYDVWLEVKGTPVFDRNGELQHILFAGREITERKKLQRHLEYLSYHDSLTGISNRRFFKEKLEQSLKEAKQYGRKLTVMFMDIDDFKQVNDRYGHDVGDELLKQFSKRVGNQLREGDIITRQGGDEFTILLLEIQEKQDAIKIADRILTSLREPWQIGKHVFLTTSSIGIAFYPKDGISRHELMKHADTALYEAKENGKNNIKVYSSKGEF